MAKKETKTDVECPVFIIFAEYFGYVSSFIKTCEAWCNGNVPELHVQKFLKVEAASIFRQMKKDYSIEESEDNSMHFSKVNEIKTDEFFLLGKKVGTERKVTKSFMKFGL